MRILCNSLAGFEPAAWAVERQHEVLRLDREAVRDAWACRDRPWPEVLLPEGWVPDVAMFWSPEYQQLPPAIWDLPCPVVLWVGDWYVDPNGLRQFAPHVDLLLADPIGAEHLRRAGIGNVAACNPWVYDPALHQRAWDEPPLYDIAFAGSLNDVIHRQRNVLLHRILGLPERYRVEVRTHVYGEEYAEVLRRSRIGFNYAVAGGANMRTFEVPASGSLLMVERSNRETARWFEPGEECVLYDLDDFEDVIAYYLEHEDERAAIAEAGWRRAREHDPAGRVPQLLDHLEAVASAPRRRRRPTLPEAARALSFNACHMPETARAYGEVEVLLDAAEQEAPGDACLLGNRALLYATYALMTGSERAGEAFADAVEYLDRAVAADPSDALARFNRAAMLHERQRDAEAAAAYAELLEGLDAGTIEVRPDRLVFRRTLDDFLVQWFQASFDDPAVLPERLGALLAARVAERLAALTADPLQRIALQRRAVDGLQSADSRTGLAAAYSAVGDHEAALRENALALEAKPLFETLWEERLTLLLALGRRDEARALAADAATLARRLPHFAHVAGAMAARVDATPPAFRPAELDAA